MKHFIFIIINLFLCISCLCQEESKSICWFSNKFIQAIEKKDTINIKNALIPIEGFEEENDTLFVLTYMGEISPVQFSRVLVNGTEVLQLINLKYYFNLKYLSKALVEKYSKAVFYLNRLGDTMELTIVERNRSEIQYFINSYKSKRFTSLRETKDYFKNLR